MKSATPQKLHVTSQSLWQITLLALPLMGSQLASIGIMTSDIIMMGALSAFDLGAGSLAIRFYQPFYFFALGLTAVISSLVAQARGRDDLQRARRVFRQGLVIALLLSAISMPIVMTGGPILKLLGQSADVADHANGFLIWTALSLPFFFLFFILRFFVTGNQHTTAQFIITLGGLAVNLILNPIFANGFGSLPAMGLEGIAVATLIAYGLMSLCLIIYIEFHRDFRGLKPFSRLWRIDLELMIYIIRLGFPNAIIVMSETGMFIVAGFMVGTFGTAALIATGIANQVAAVTFMVPLAIAQASAITVGKAAGSQDPIKLMSAGWSAFIMGCLVAIPMTLIYILQPEWLAHFFIDDADALYGEVMPILLAMLFYVGLFQLVDGLQVIENAKLRGLNDTKEPAKMALICYWGIGLGCAWLFAFIYEWGPASVWAGLGFGLLASAVILTQRWRVHMREIASGRAILIR